MFRFVLFHILEVSKENHMNKTLVVWINKPNAELTATYIEQRFLSTQLIRQRQQIIIFRVKAARL